MKNFKKILLSYLSICSLYLYSSNIVGGQISTASKTNPGGQLNIRITKDNFADFRESLLLNYRDENIRLNNVFFSNINLKLASVSHSDIITSLREPQSAKKATKPVIEDKIPNIYNINLLSHAKSSNNPVISYMPVSQNNYAGLSVSQLIQKSQALARSKKPEEALKYLDNAVIKAGKNSWNLAEIADNYERIRAIGKSDKTWEKAVTISPNRIELLYAYSLFLSRNNQFNKANKYLNRIVSINPQFMLAYYNLGNIYFKNKQFLNAIKAYSAAISINPYCEDAFYNLALSLEAINQKTLAITHYKECMKLNPSDKQAKQALRRLKAIK